MPAPDPSPQPSPRGTRTRRRILKAAERAFAQKPFAAVHLKRDILDPAEISVGSFYHQFTDKAELLKALVEEHSALLQSQFAQIHRPGVERSGEKIAREAYSLLFDMVDEAPDMMRIRMRQSASQDEVGEFMGRDNARWAKARAEDYRRLALAYDLDIDPELASEMIGLLVSGALRRYLSIPIGDRAAARTRLLEGLIGLTLHGIQGLA